MPINPTCPGVYIQELPSGVRTISGASTSVAAFVGYTEKGPVNEPVRVFDFGSFQREFGFSSNSELAYAVSQFFMNGGGEALIVRVADDAAKATVTLKSDAQSDLDYDGYGLAPEANDVLTLEARSEGVWGNRLGAVVEYDNLDNPDSTFKLTVHEYDSAGEPLRTETFWNLTMNESATQYVESVVNATSKLVRATVRTASAKALMDEEKGYLFSGAPDSNDDPAALVNENQNRLRISIDGGVPLEIPLETVPPLDTRKKIADHIEQLVQAASTTDDAYSEFVCAVGELDADEHFVESDEGTRFLLMSGNKGPSSSVVVLPASDRDASAALKLTPATGAIRVDAVASARPAANTPAYPKYIFADGVNGTPPTSNSICGEPSEKKGIYALEKTDGFNLLCIPLTYGLTQATDAAAITSAAVAYCERKRAFYIIDPPQATTEDPTSINPDWKQLAPQSANAAVYFPSVKVPDPLNDNRLRAIAASGTIAGLYARTDATRGIWKAPAGTDASLGNVQALTYQLNDGQTGTLNSNGINCLRTFPVYGTVAWGARTLLGADPRGSEWKYVPVRRLALYIEESLFRGTQWVVFEPNDEPLWSQIRLNIGAFMNRLFRQGAFQGKSPKEAYFVKCDKETTTQDDINRGVVNILVGFAPLKPAEFVVISIQQMAGQINT